jgi:hypothetical protein
MNSILKYRIIALALVAVFGTFNVGIPVVIASCSMGGMMQGGSCPMCADRQNPTTETFTTDQSKVCCTTTIVAEPNTNEFVQAKASLSDLSKPLLVVLTVDVLVPVLQSPVHVIRVSSSPPTVLDIPILTSSLLI